MKNISKRFVSVLRNIYEIEGGGERFRSMEGLRAYAALLIFFVHYFDAYFREHLGQETSALDITSGDSLSFKIFYYLYNSHFGVDIFLFLERFFNFPHGFERSVQLLAIHFSPVSTYLSGGIYSDLLLGLVSNRISGLA